MRDMLRRRAPGPEPMAGPVVGLMARLVAGLAVGLVMMVGVVPVSAAARTRPAAVSDDPEITIRALVKAIYANDVAAYEQLTLPDPRRARLVQGGSVNQEKLRQLKEDPSGLQMVRKQPFRYRGQPVAPDASGVFPAGTTVHYMVAHYGSPMMVTLVRKPEGWKVDLRWWLAMLDLASGAPPKPDSPEFAVRSLTAALIALDKQKAAQFVAPPVNLDALFAGAPSSREPSGHLDALVYEMGLVEIGPGEFSTMPSGHIVEGSSADDRKVLVGFFGSVEVPYVLRRVGFSWKVIAEPYFLLLMQ